MFLPGRKDADPDKMTAREIAQMTVELMGEDGFKEMLGEDFEVTKEQHLKAQKVVESLIKLTNPTADVTLDTMYGFRAGVAYGLGLSTKMTLVTDELKRGLEDGNKDTVQKILRQLAFIFYAVDAGVKNWKDDHWLDNLMKNAKVQEAPVTTKKIHDDAPTTRATKPKSSK